MKKVSYRSQKVGESENATKILSKLKAYLSLQSLLLGMACYSYGSHDVRLAQRQRGPPAQEERERENGLPPVLSLQKAAQGRLRERTLAAYRPYSSSTLSEETWSIPTISLPTASIKLSCHTWLMPNPAESS